MCCWLALAGCKASADVAPPPAASGGTPAHLTGGAGWSGVSAGGPAADRDAQSSAGTLAAASGGRVGVSVSVSVSGSSQAGTSAAAGSGGSAPSVRAARFDAGSDPNRNKVSAADVCKRLAEIECAAEAYCCDSPGRSVDACKAEIVRACSQDLMLDQAAQNPITGFDAATAERAYTELENKASRCDPSVAAWASMENSS